VNGFDIDVELERGEAPFRLAASLRTPPGITVIFGPSGAGKSSLLLAVLGGLRPTRGRIEVGGRILFDAAGGVELAIRRRGVGMVFQDALLFPHLDVLRNVAFGLRGTERASRARELLARVGAAELASRSTRELSGGERQRVALARSLAASPRALLLDEPFSALDHRSRDELGRLLLELQAEAGIPFLYVTHDLAEALRLGDHLVLLDGGKVSQSGPPAEVIARPTSIASARAVGTENLYRGTVTRHHPDAGYSEVDLGGTTVRTVLLGETPGSRVALGLRAEDILLSLEPLHCTSARNVLDGRIESISDDGPMVEVRVATPVAMRVLVTPEALRELALERGKAIHLLIKASAFHRLV